MSAYEAIVLPENWMLWTNQTAPKQKTKHLQPRRVITILWPCKKNQRQQIDKKGNICLIGGQCEGNKGIIF